MAGRKEIHISNEDLLEMARKSMERMAADYERQVTEADSRPYNLLCIICGKAVEYCGPSEDRPKLSKAGNDCWHDAIVHNIVGGYGSGKFDCTELVAAICDDCGVKAVEDKRLLVLYDR